MGRGRRAQGEVRAGEKERRRLETTRWPCDVEKGGGVRACVRA